MAKFNPCEPALVCRKCVIHDVINTFYETLSRLVKLNDLKFDLNDLEIECRDNENAIFNLINNLIDSVTGWPPLCKKHHEEIEP